MAYYSDGTKMIEGGQIKSGLDTAVWQTSASLGSIYHAGRANGGGISFSATSSAGLTVEYEHVAGTLPPGTSLSGNSLTGTISAVSSDTSYTFTIRAKTLLTVDREFTVTIKAPTVVTFNYTGSNQSWTIPSGVTSIEAYMWGAAGGGAYGEGFSDPGGPGGYSSATINVSSFSSLTIQVGQGGSYSTRRTSYPSGGAQSLRSGYASGSGGGRTGIHSSSTINQSTALLIAGGGGGGSGHGGGAGYSGEGGHGGGGGGTNGEQGYSTYISQPNNGASQSAGGSGTASGGALSGATAGNGTSWNSGGWNMAGGGGDGYYGGGAYNHQHQGGGGGAGYINTTYCSGATTTGTTVGNARVSVTYPPQTGHTYYSTGIGRGNNASDGGNGKCFIVY